MNKIIAIDGPAGSGKSTTARLLASKLGFKFLNTGAFYRALTYYCLGQEVPLEDGVSVLCAALQFAEDTKAGNGLDISLDPDVAQVKIAHEDVTEALQSPELTSKVYHISANREVREVIVKMQQSLVEQFAESGIVLEGRDVTDVVAPQAKVKVLLTASIEARAKRRSSETGEDERAVQKAISIRDAKDSEVNTFLHAQEGVYQLDNSSLSVDETAERIVQIFVSK
jgi:cytidylate kinase